MERSTEDALTPEERQDREVLVELGGTRSLVPAQALHLLGRTPEPR
jgi:hypothetical protein